MGLSFVITKPTGGGTTGAGIQSITYKSTDSDGNFIYEFELTNGAKFDVKMPKGHSIDMSTPGNNEILVKTADGVISGSGIFVNGDDISTVKDIIAKSIEVDPTTIKIGGIKLRENAAFLENIPDTTNKRYLFVDYENDSINGTTKPVYWKRGIKNEGNDNFIKIFDGDTTDYTFQNDSVYHYGNPTTDSEVQAIYLKFAQNVTNFKMAIIINDVEMAWFPSKSAWKGLEAGTDFNSGRRKLDLIPHISFLSAYDIKIKFRADNNIILRGDNGHLKLYVDRNLITKKEMALMEDIPTISGGSMTGQQIVSEMEKLTGDSRLSSSAVKDIPVYDDTALKSSISTNGGYIQTNKADITKLKTQVNRIKTEIGDSGLDTFTGRFSHDISNVIPKDYVYKGYFMSFYDIDDSMTVTLPPSTLNIDEGTFFTFDNTDPNTSFIIQAPSGETIDGAVRINIPADNLWVLVKTSTGYAKVFGGFLPSSLSDLMSQIKSAMPSQPVTQPMTFDQIESHFKDRLHTFREIANEFADQLHTYNNIENELINRGYNKGMAAYWALSSTNSITGATFQGTVIEPNQIITTSVETGNKYFVIAVSEELNELIDGYNLDSVNKEFTATDFEKNNRRFVLLISNETIDTTSQHQIYLVLNNSGSGSSGIEIDDGSTNKAGINKVNIEGAYLSKVFDDSDEVTLVCATEFEQQGGVGGGRVNKVYVENPLNSYLDPNIQPGQPSVLKLGIQHGYYELAKPPGYLAYLTENEEIIGRIKPNEAGVRVGAIWFDDIIVGGNSPDIDIDRPNKTIGIEDYTGDDPNVTGGVPTLIAYRIAMKGKAPNDGFVEIMLKKKDEGTPTQNGDYMLDSNGNPIGLRHQYKAGDDLGVLDCMAIYMAKEQVKFQCLLEHNFADDGVLIEDRTEGASGILIQALGNDYATGDALLQFENDTMQNIEMTKHYNGEDIFNMAWALGYDQADVDINAGSGQTSVDGLHFYNNTNLKVGITNKTMHIHDNGTDMVYFSLGQIFSAERTYMLRGKDLDIKVTLQDKDSGFNIYMVKWTGQSDKYTKKIVSDYQNLNPVYEANWEESGKIFISEDAVSGEHDFAGTLTVPADANNFAVIIVPVEKQYPMDLYLKGFEVNVSEPFYGWILEAPELIGEKHLQFDKMHAELRCDLPNNSMEIRYTLNDVPAGMPMPIGIISSGKADIEIDHTINQVSGSSLPQFEGAIKFNKEGKATIKTDLYVHSEKANSVLATTSFWYSKVSSDGNTFTKIPLSEYTTQVRGQTKAINHMPRFKIDVQPGDRIALFGTTDQADGAFIDTTESHVPMLKTTITFDEITAEEQSVLDLIHSMDEIEFVDGEQPAQGKWRMKIDIKTGKTTVEEVV